MEAYYTDAERDFVVNAYRTLRRALGNELSPQETATLRQIIEGGIERGIAPRDKYGINPTVRHFNTALLFTEYIGADKNITIATLIYHCARPTICRRKKSEAFSATTYIQS